MSYAEAAERARRALQSLRSDPKADVVHEVVQLGRARVRFKTDREEEHRVLLLDAGWELHDTPGDDTVASWRPPTD